MADRAVVVIDFVLIVAGPEGSLDKARFVFPLAGSSERRDHVLMFVVRELDGELAFVFRLRRVSSIVRFAKSETRIFARCGARVTDSANRRASAGESLPRKELLSVAAHAGVVIGKVCGVREISFRRPVGRQFVTSVARDAFVFLRRVQKS